MGIFSLHILWLSFVGGGCPFLFLLSGQPVTIFFYYSGRWSPRQWQVVCSGWVGGIFDFHFTLVQCRLLVLLACIIGVQFFLLGFVLCLLRSSPPWSKQSYNCVTRVSAASSSRSRPCSAWSQQKCSWRSVASVRTACVLL